MTSASFSRNSSAYSFRKHKSVLESGLHSGRELCSRRWIRVAHCHCHVSYRGIRPRTPELPTRFRTSRHEIVLSVECNDTISAAETCIIIHTKAQVRDRRARPPGGVDGASIKPCQFNTTPPVFVDKSQLNRAERVAQLIIITLSPAAHRCFRCPSIRSVIMNTISSARIIAEEFQSIDSRHCDSRAPPPATEFLHRTSRRCLHLASR